MGEKSVALVTGANKGIGFEISRQLGRQGFAVILAARDEKKVNEAADQRRRRDPLVGGRASGIPSRVDELGPFPSPLN